MEIVTGKYSKPKKPEEKIKEWEEKDSLAQEIIVTRVEESVLTHLLSCTSSSEIWNKLLTVFEPKSRVSVHLIQQKFFNLAFEEPMSIFIAKIEDLCNQLKSMGEELSESMVMTKMVMTLPEKYKHFVSAWESVPQQQQNLRELTSRLLVEEERSKNTLEVDTSAALVVNEGERKRRNQNYRGGSANHANIKCFSCGKNGHIKRDCVANRTCYYCRKPGHTINACRYRLNKLQPIDNKNDRNESGKDNAFVTNFSDEKSWLVDTGASEHMCYDRNLFSTYTELSNVRKVVIGDGSELNAVGYGIIKLKAYNGEKWINTTLNNVLYVPKMTVNLFSVRNVMDNGYKMLFDSETCKIEKGGKVCAVGHRENKLYVMEFTQSEYAATARVEESLQKWHERLAHQNKEYVKAILNRKNIKYTEDEQVCDGCLKGKMHKSPFKRSNTVTTEVCELIHMDVCGPMEVLSLGGSKYFLLIRDDYSCYRYVYFLANKSQVVERISQFIKLAERETGKKVKTIRTDNGTEFINKELSKICQTNGIRHQTSVAYTPEQNGKAERDNRTVVEAARSMLIAKNLDKFLWAEAVNTAIYILNRTGKSTVQDKAPYEIWFNKSFDINLLRTFGTEVYVLIPKQKRLKWDSKSTKGLLVGYGEDTKGYRVYFPESKTVEVKRDVIFKEQAEKGKVEKQMGEKDDQEVAETADEEEIPEISEGTTEEETRKREGRKPAWLADYETSFLTQLEEPTSYEEAVTSAHSEKWKEAMDNELKVLHENNTWTEVPTPTGKKIIDSKWVYKIKYDNDGKPFHFKARLVAKGFQQVQNFEIHDIYAPVARITTFRIVLAIANKFRLPVHHMDVRSAFLYGDIHEEVYMNLPKGTACNKGIVCRLNKSIYGLKKSPKYWNMKFHTEIVKKGFIRSENDCCLYTKCNSGYKIYLLLFVDDILLFSTDESELVNLKCYLSKIFCMKDLGLVTNYLGISVKQDLINGVTELDQSNYLKQMLEKFNMTECKPMCTPMENKFQFIKPETSDVLLETKCRQIIGSIMYTVICTRPDLCASVSYLSRYQNYANNELYKAIKRILRYIKDTVNLKLVFQSNQSSDMLCGFVDSDWGNDLSTRKSTTGFVFKLFGCTVAWLSKKQQTVSLSSTEAEYIALCTAVVEACWLDKLLNDFKLFIVSTIVMHVDNQAAINIGNNPENNKRVKHIDIKFYFVKQKIEDNVISLRYVKSEEQIADIFTKPLGKEKFVYFRNLLCLL